MFPGLKKTVGWIWDFTPLGETELRLVLMFLKKQLDKLSYSIYTDDNYTDQEIECC